jgi:hypothetical protein
MLDAIHHNDTARDQEAKKEERLQSIKRLRMGIENG